LDKLEYAVVLSAGLGSRLKEKTASLPKVMLPFAGKPLLGHHFDWLRGYGIRRVFINTHFLPEVIRDYAGDGAGFGLEIVYSYEPQLLGTAGALNGFSGLLDAPFLVHYGDVYSELNLARLWEFHLHKGAVGTLVVHPTHRPHDSDVVVMDEQDRVISVHHKPGTNRFGSMGNAACKVFHPAILRHVPPGPSDFIQDVIPSALAAGLPIYAYDTNDFLMDMGTPDRHAKLEEYLAGR
jgi:NDP-sugar pyrophosphorylase family protein